MKTLGLIGGMSWESTLPYYRIINERIKHRLGGLHSAKLVLHSVDFHEIELLQTQGDWGQAARLLGDIACGLRQAGAEVIVICTNTMHKVADDVEQISGLPVLHIADATGRCLLEQRMTRVGLLGTRYTMEQDFYRRRIEERFGIAVMIPSANQREAVNRIIYDELCRGIVREDSRKQYQAIISELAQQGAEGVILGCTEIPLLIQAKDAKIPLFETSTLHATAAADYAIGDYFIEK